MLRVVGYLVTMLALARFFAPVPSEGGSVELPVGLQLIGAHLDEGRLLNAAHAYQQATDWHTRRPDGV